MTKILGIALGVVLGAAVIGVTLLGIAAILGFLWNLVAVALGLPTLELWMSFILVLMVWIAKKLI